MHAHTHSPQWASLHLGLRPLLPHFAVHCAPTISCSLTTPIPDPASAQVPQTLHPCSRAQSGPERSFQRWLSGPPSLSWCQKSKWHHPCSLFVESSYSSARGVPLCRLLLRDAGFLRREVLSLVTHLRWVKTTSSLSLSFLFLRGS